MALMKLPILPGLFKDDSPLDAEGYVIDANLMRLRRGKWQTIGGWESANIQKLKGIARGGHSWGDLASTRAAMFGSAAYLEVLYGGQLLDVTPEQKARGTLVNPFETTSGSTTVTVRHKNHGLKDGDVITYSLADPTGGLTLNGPYPVTIKTFESYTVAAVTAATSTAANGGGTVEYSVPFDVGLVDGIGGLGFGSGAFGDGPFGIAVSGDIHARVWSIANFGHLGLALPTNGALYEWQPAASYPELVDNGTFATADGWTFGTGWTLGTNKATATAGTPSTLSRDQTGKISGGVTYEAVFKVTRTSASGGVQFRVVSAASNTPVDYAFGETITKTATYTRRFTAPPNPTLIKFDKDANFAGSVEIVSIKMENTAYRIQDAPPYSRHMFIDPNGFVVLLGTVQINGEFNANAIRWSNQRDSRTWFSTADGITAGEYTNPIIGSELRGGIATRGQNLLLTDAAAYTMRFTNTVDVFRIDYVGSGCGLVHKNAIAEHNGVVAWWSSAKEFKIFTGGAVQSIDCTVLRDVMDNLSPGQESKISAGVNAAFGEFWWCYPDRRDGAGLENSRCAVWNWLEDKWTVHRLPRTQWISDRVYPNPIGTAPDGSIYFHELGRTDNGDAMTWELTTADFDLGDGEYLMLLDRIVADFEDQAGVVNVEVSVKAFPNGPLKTYPPSVSRTNTLKIDRRYTGRQVRFRFFGTGAPAFARFGAIKIDVRQTASKR